MGRRTSSGSLAGAAPNHRHTCDGARHSGRRHWEKLHVLLSVYCEVKGNSQDLTTKGIELARKIVVNNLIILLLTVLCMWGIVYSILQLYFIIFRCDMSLWNLAGCVEMKDIKYVEMKDIA